MILTISESKSARPFASRSEKSLKFALAELERIDRERSIERYRPYSKQADFHAAGSHYRERLFRAGNQLGKTFAGAAEMSYHLTGEYPAWWRGRRWDRPIRAWVGGKSSIDVRDAPVRLLLGEATARGTGLVPKRRIIDIAPARGIADGVDYVAVRHVSGRDSTLTVKTYDQGRERWQASTLDLVWFDEEPPADIYTEGLTRTNATSGCVYITFTPLLGMSEVVMRFLGDPSPDRHDTNMTIEDAEHISPEERARIIASYAPHEREARVRGTPILGSGRIFPVAEEAIKVEAFRIPPHWARLGAMDLGWDHPFAAVEIAYDVDSDIAYIVWCYRARQETPIMHAGALKPRGAWLPWAWPHDALNETSAGGGVALKAQYVDHGLNMLAERAQYPSGSTSVEAGLMDMLDRMETGRLKVFDHLASWFEEFRIYHRKDGKVVKQMDDLMSATRYGIMMLRHAILPPDIRAQIRREREKNRPVGVDPLRGF